MCGIFGAIGDATDAMLSAARGALHHRGPDSGGAWRDGTAGLAQTRLKIIDLSDLAAQPMPGCSPSVQMVFNGEIYNHHALRRELEARGHRFRSHGSDSETIVHGYEEWGAGVVERLDGMFALAVWDARARRLLLARDRTGKKPLFYAVSPDGLVLHFASEIKALVAAGHRDRLDRATLPMFLSWGYVPAPRTLHEGVLSLAPAEKLSWTPGRAPTVESYWRPTFLEPPLDISFSEARTRVRELVIAAVERRLESDVPLGAFLSGGVDSTIVVGVMARVLGRRVRSFSIGFQGDPRFDETDYAREAARTLGSDHTELVLDPTSVASIEKLVWLHDGPFTDSSAIPTCAISEKMKQHVTVALSGDGGDELFAGYLRFLAAEAAEKIPRAVRDGLVHVGELLPGGLPHHSLGARARRFLVAANLSLADRLGRWNSAFAGQLEKILRPETASQLDLDGPETWQRGFFGGPASPLAQILDHNFRTYLAYDLQTKVDRCSAGSAFEVRAPFLDTALVEYAGRLPDRFKRRGTRTKYILREAFSDLLPPRIARRGKMGFAVPLAAWFRGDLRDYLLETLAPGARLYEYIDAAAARALVDEHLSTRADRSAQIWTLLTLEVWLNSLSAQNREKAERREARIHH